VKEIGMQDNRGGLDVRRDCEPVFSSKSVRKVRYSEQLGEKSRTEIRKLNFT
jgi:hypothetical protein